MEETVTPTPCHQGSGFTSSQPEHTRHSGEHVCIHCCGKVTQLLRRTTMVYTKQGSHENPLFHVAQLFSLLFITNSPQPCT